MNIDAPILLDNVSSNREAFLALRKTHIGASEVPAILGLNKYQTALDLWMLKTGKAKPTEDNDRLWYGREHEPLVAKLYGRRKNVAVQHVDKVYGHPEIPWLMASPDYIAYEENLMALRLLECKTVGIGSRDEWSDSQAPDAAVVQLLVQMGITGLHVGNCCSIVAGDVEKAYFPEFTFSMKFWDVILEKIIHFKNCVDNNVVPELQATDMKLLHELCPATNPDTLDLNQFEEMPLLMDQLRLQTKLTSDFRKGLSREETRLAELKAKVRLLMGEHQNAHFGDVKFKISQVNVKGYEVQPRTDTRFTVKFPKEESDE